MPKGRTATPATLIFILTSNIPAEKHAGFVSRTSRNREAPARAVKGRFRAEFHQPYCETSCSARWTKADIQSHSTPDAGGDWPVAGGQVSEALHVTDEAADLIASQGLRRGVWGAPSAPNGARHWWKRLWSRLILSGG